MTRIAFTPHLARHVELPNIEVDRQTVRELLESAFTASPKLRGYILDDQGRLRQHVAVFVDGRPLVDRVTLSDSAIGVRELYVMQALSGG